MYNTPAACAIKLRIRYAPSPPPKASLQNQDTTAASSYEV
jgi:hypothetical protein